MWKVMPMFCKSLSIRPKRNIFSPFKVFRFCSNFPKINLSGSHWSDMEGRLDWVGQGAVKIAHQYLFVFVWYGGQGGLLVCYQRDKHLINPPLWGNLSQPPINISTDAQLICIRLTFRATRTLSFVRRLKVWVELFFPLEAEDSKLQKKSICRAHYLKYNPRQKNNGIVSTHVQFIFCKYWVTSTWPGAPSHCEVWPNIWKSQLSSKCNLNRASSGFTDLHFFYECWGLSKAANSAELDWGTSNFDTILFSKHFSSS